MDWFILWLVVGFVSTAFSIKLIHGRFMLSDVVLAMILSIFGGFITLFLIFGLTIGSIVWTYDYLKAKEIRLF